MSGVKMSQLGTRCYLEALDGVLQRFVRFLQLLSLGTKLAQETSSIA